MDILLYRDDGLGDALFTIPTLKIIIDNLKEEDRLFFASPHSSWIKNIIQDHKLIPVGVKKNDIEKYVKGFDIALFLGPWGKIKNLDHFKIIISTNANYKFISSYRGKLVFNFLKSFYKIFYPRILSGKNFFIDFEEIFEDHDIVNTFNFVSKALEVANFSSFMKFKSKVFKFYDYENFFNGNSFNGNFFNFSCYSSSEPLQGREKNLIIHFTYKSFSMGFGLDGYKVLLNDLSRFWKGEIVLVFGPYEMKYFDLMEGINQRGIKKMVVTNLNDYMELCLKSYGMIGFDTGPVHLAAFFNVPLVVSIFPAEGFENRVKRWKPYSNKSTILVFRYSEIERGVGNTPLIDYLNS